MASLPVDVLLGISHGLLMSLVPVVGIGSVSFAYKYLENTELAPPMAVAASVPLGLAGGVATGLFDVATLAAAPVEGLPRLVTALVVVALVSMYANSQAAKLAKRLPRDRSQPTSRERPLAPEALDAVDGMGKVTITAVGDIRDIDGYAPLQADLRTELENQSWQLPADIPIVEMERRLEDRLRSTYDLPAVSVSVDARGTATIAAAPPSRNLAATIDDGWRAISVETLLPTGLSPGDEVIVIAGKNEVDGVVLGTADTSGGGQDTDGVTGGRGLATVAVPTISASEVLNADDVMLAVQPSGTRDEFRAFSLLVRAGYSIRKVLLDESTRADLKQAEDPVEVLAVRSPDGEDPSESNWTFSPDHLRGDAAFLLGEGPVLEQLTADDTVGVSR